jgi:uncharacterized protein YfaS (alpha-2-macroglobulin family)
MDRSRYKVKVEAKLPERLKPSSKASIVVSLNDSQGKPISGRVSLALVDEGILSLTGFKVPNPLKFFTRSRSPRVWLYDLYHLLLPLENEILPFLTPGGGDESASDGLFSSFRRQQELLSVFLGTIDIPASGQATVELDIPEYSGQARLALVAESYDRFGSYSTSVKISRDLTVEPTLPLALAPGDSFISTVRVFLAPKSDKSSKTQNKPTQAKGSGSNKKTLVELNFSTQGPLILEKITEENGQAVKNPYRPKLEPGEAKTFKVFLRAADLSSGQVESLVGPAELVIAASGNDENFTQMAGTVVRPPFPRTNRSEGQQLSQSETDLTIDYSSFLPGTTEASLALAAGPAVEAAKAAVFLQEYPYGCLEQTVSKAWANLVALEMGYLSGSDTSTEAKLALDGVIKRLATMKTFQGGFSSWPENSYPFPWGSVYAVHFLIEASRVVELPQGLLEDGIEYLKAILVHSRPSDNQRYVLGYKAYAAFVLALYGENIFSQLNFLKERKDGLSNTALIYLAGAESLMVGRSDALIELEKSEIHLDKFQNDYYMESSSGNLALLLYAWTGVDPLNPRAAELAALVAQQGRQGHWTTTQENGLAIMALGSFMRKTGGSAPYQAVISNSLGQTLVKGGEHDQLKLDRKALKSLSDNKLKISLTGEGRPWYSLIISGVPIEPLKPESNVLSISKRWKIAPKGQYFPVGQTENEPPLVVKRGQVVEVEITLEASQVTDNVVLADLLPGGFEIVGLTQKKLPQTSDDGDDQGDNNNYDEYSDEYREEYDDEYGSDQGHDSKKESPHLELREDRVISIWPTLKGRITLNYNLRAVTTGEFILPPTTVEGMYQPEHKAVLATSKVTVQE